ncbi:unnamed protein product [Symbiodinium sp. CCMP2592]|nr:unnamed protein product [Symbiodinium sp. CCMP2592]
MSELIIQMEEEGFFDQFFPYGSGGAQDGKSTAPTSTAEEEEPRKWQRKGETGRFAGPGKGSRGQWARDNNYWKRGREPAGWHTNEAAANKDRDEMELEIKELRDHIFQLQRLALRQEDLIAAIRPEMIFVIFARIDVGASIVPSIYKAQAAWRELKESDPSAIHAPMRVDLLRCLFTELKTRLKNLTQDAQQQQNLVQMGWLKADPVSWHYIRWDQQTQKHKIDDTKEPLKYEKVAEIVEGVLYLVQKIGVVSRFHPSRPVEEEMRGKSIAFTLQLAMMSDKARTLRQYLTDLSGLAAMQLLATTMRPEKPGRSALANLIQRAMQLQHNRY